MQYIELKLTIQPNEEYIVDLLASYLGEIGFESFEEDVDGMVAYIQREEFNEDALKHLLANFPYTTDIQYEIINVDQINWNEEWEKHYFEPIVIGDKCVIHSSFHTDVPQAEYDIVIDPKMSFGTGHHETTSLMIEEILSVDLNGKLVLDMGCGTAVLAILAAKRGAKPVIAIDIDPWCTENSAENIQTNGVNWIQIELGGAEKLKTVKADVIFANINRNILLEDMKQYSASLNEGGVLYMSGFYTADIPVLEEEMNHNGLKLISSREKNNWAVVTTIKL
ncbi:MAG: ribosomal protein L11 methyltransferase [Paludibacter sp. 47-17]|jgi:ribosomal protein L11 methyltransferase|nr:MAG: ribosomal protein L11 methyltransferase [Paludibacter sp. 47-17]